MGDYPNFKNGAPPRAVISMRKEYMYGTIKEFTLLGTEAYLCESSKLRVESSNVLLFSAVVIF
jgi:hypothetical protein